MKIAFSWDDGAMEDQKLFELHEKYRIPGMFFIPTRNREGRKVITPEIMRNSESKYVQFGGHTDNHTYLTQIPIDNVEIEVVKNKEYLEDVLGHRVQDFCLPGGKYNPEILEIISKHFSTIRTADTMNFSYLGGVLKPAIHFYPRSNKSLLGNALRNKSYSQAMYVALHYGDAYFDLVSNLIAKESLKKDSLIMIWGHSWEIEEYQLWDRLESFMQLNYISQNAVTYRKCFD